MIVNDYKRDIIYIARNFEEISASQSSEIELSSVQTRINEYIVKYELTYRNNGNATEIIPVFQRVSDGVPFFYMTPCVNYNGNEWGTCKEPKGMEQNGEPWIFSADRGGVPACTVAQFEGYCSAIFSDNKGLSHNSSGSIFCRDGKTVQRIYFSHLEYPTVYLLKYEYGEPIVEFIPFDSGESKTFVCYTYDNRGHRERFGYGQMFDFLNLSYAEPLTARFDADTINEYNFEFISSLVERYGDGYISNMGFLPDGEHRLGDPNSKFKFRNVGKHEIGWCGQNITIAEMHIRRYLQTKDSSALQIGVGILDTWSKRQHSTGAVSVAIDRAFDGGEWIDSCNEGWLLWKLLWCCDMLKKLGVDVSKYEKMATGIANYYLEYFPSGAFPQISNGAGGTVTKDGCAGAMLVLGFIEAYKYFGDQKYFDRAKRAYDFYYDTYLLNSIAAGGALDTYCIDKESAGPMLRASLWMYDVTGEEEYVAKAKQVAYYLMSWTYYHDIEFPSDSDCAKLCVRTTGGTSVSTAHQHLDVWGAYYVPDMFRLYTLTGNEAFREQARMLWLFTLQYVSDGTLTLHGMTRGKGAENEAVLHCNWNWSKDGKKGQLNDWLVSWVVTFKMDAYYALKDTDFFDNI